MVNHYRLARSEGTRTNCKICHPGKPRSRQKDQHILEAVASMPIFAEKAMVATMLIMAAVPATEPVQSRKICMKGYFVGVSRVFSTSFRLNRVASSTASPKAPLMKILVMMERGTTRLVGVFDFFRHLIIIGENDSRKPSWRLLSLHVLHRPLLVSSQI